MIIPSPSRNTRLDVLRCIAVVVVIMHHAHISSFFTQVGWAGVDLFFVLSGFLISGLLFGEYKKRHSIGFRRFFIRRGLKIYPAFYVFLLLTAIVSYCAPHVKTLDPTHFGLSTPARYLHEIFFVQNYGHGVWDHTWSLAIEEHFYIFLPILLLILIRASSNRGDPFRILPRIWIAIAILCMGFRAVSAYAGPPNLHMTYTASHERMDALFFGVLLGYLHHFRPLALENLVRGSRKRLVIAVISTGLLSSSYFFPRESRSFAVWGYTAIYLGFGGILVLSLYGHGILPPALAWIAGQIGKGFAFVGMYSYSIYLWHGPCGSWLPGLLRHTLGFPTGDFGRFAVYFVGSLAVGIFLSRLIEYPVLRLRDRLFPGTQSIPVPASVPFELAQSVAAEVGPFPG